MSDIPQGLHISGAYGDFHLTIGDHELSDLQISTVGPIVENQTPGDPNPLYVAWIPVVFEGAIDDPEGILRIVHMGEAEKVGLPSVDEVAP